jgi:hypothetical protein
MTIQSISLNSFIPSSNTIVGGVAIDGYSDSKPVRLERRNGQVMPAVGTIVELSYGTGRVVGYTPSALRVVVTDYNDDFEFITADETDIFDASEYVKSLNKAIIRSVECKRRTFTRVNKSEITGVLSVTNQKHMDEALPMPAKTEVHVMLDANYPFPADTQVLATVIAAERETPSERQARIRRERRMATAMANAMLSAQADDEAIPADVQAELDEMFGE